MTRKQPSGTLGKGVVSLSASPAFWQYLFLAACFFAWTGAAQVLPSYLMPGPVEVGGSIWEMLTVPALARNALASVLHVVCAVGAAFVIGMCLALLAHYFPVFRTLIHRRISSFLNSFSGIAWALLGVLWFGVNQFTVIFAVTVILLPFTLINLREGLANLDAEIVEMGQSFSLLTLRNLRLVILPLLLPFIVATLRISFGVAWKVTLTAELLGGDKGLGYIANIATQEQNTARIVAICLMIVVFVRVLDKFGFEPVQRHLASAYQRI